MHTDEETVPYRGEVNSQLGKNIAKTEIANPTLSFPLLYHHGKRNSDKSS